MENETKMNDTNQRDAKTKAEKNNVNSQNEQWKTNANLLGMESDCIRAQKNLEVKLIK